MADTDIKIYAPVSADQSSLVSIDVSVENTDPDYDHTVWTVVDVYGLHSGTLYYNDILDETDIILSGETKWYSFNFTMPDEDVEIRGTTYLPSNGSWYVDDTYDIIVDVNIPVPTVWSLPAEGIDEESAVLRGKVEDDNGGTLAEYGFQWGETSFYTQNWESSSPPIEGAEFQHIITGLEPGQTYHFRAKARNVDGDWGYGGDLTFTTEYVPPPTVETLAASGIDTSSAFLQGQVTYNEDDEDCDDWGFDWGLTTSYGNSWEAGSSVGEDETFMHLITGLGMGETYHFRAKAHNLGGWGYGADRTFTTLSTIPIPGYIWVDGDYFHYIDEENKDWGIKGYDGGYTGGVAGYLWAENGNLNYIDESGRNRWIPGLYSSNVSGAKDGYLWLDAGWLWLTWNQEKRYIKVDP